MRKFILAGLLALPLLVLNPARLLASGCCNGCYQSPTLNFGFGMRIGFHKWCFCEKPTINPCLPGKPHKHKHHGCQAPGCPTGGYGCGYGGGDPSCAWGAGAPWYLFWPMDAHFRMPAPTGYPYWPAPQTTPPGFSSCYGYHLPAFNHYGLTYPLDANAVQPAGYYPQVPTYWYGR